jgi:hypothetical protein
MAGSADVLVRTASKARAAFSRFALIADADVRAPSIEGSVKLAQYQQNLSAGTEFPVQRGFSFKESQHEVCSNWLDQ